MSRFQPHRHVLVSLADMLRELGAHIHMKRYCADLLSQHLNGEIKEAWLDLCANFLGHMQLWRLDVTLRTSWAQEGRAMLTPGLGALAGVAKVCAI